MAHRVEEVVHSAHSGPPPVGPYLRRLRGYRHFVLELSSAEIEGGHADTHLGRLWSLLNPVLLAAVYFLLLTVVRGGRTGPRDVGFVALVGGLFAYTWTRNTLGGARTSILRGSKLVLSATVPRMALPVAAVLTASRLYLPALGVYAVLHLGTGRLVTPWLTVLPVILFLHLCLNVGLALLVSVGSVLVRDLGTVMQYVMRLAVYATPVLFTVQAITDVGLRWVLYVNPVGGLIGVHQQVLSGIAPAPDLLAASTVWATATLAVGTAAFLRLEHQIAPRL